MKNGTKGHILYYTTYLPKDTITKIEVQNEKILKLLSKKWTIYRDLLKKEYCQLNNIPLIEIKYIDYDKLNLEYLRQVMINEGLYN